MKQEKNKIYYNNYFNDYRGNVKKIWEGLYTAMEMTKNKKFINLNITDEFTGDQYKHEKPIVQQFAKYFEQVPINVRNKLPIKRPDYNEYLPRSLSNSRCISMKPVFMKYLTLLIN